MTLTQNIFGASIFPVSWSLCVEEHFYLLFPLTSFFILKSRLKVLLIPLVILIMLSSLFLRDFFYSDLLQNKILVQNTVFNLEGLAIGVLIAYISVYKKKLWNGLHENLRWVEISGTILMSFAFFIGAEKDSYLNIALAPFLFALSFGLFVVSGNFKESVFSLISNKFFELTAELAYPLYLTHCLAWMVVGIFFKRLGLLREGAIFTFICLMSAYLMAYICHILVERPFLKYRKKLLLK